MVTAEAAHQERRLYVVPLAAVLEQADRFAGELGAITGRSEQAEAREAPSYRRVLQAQSLGRDGLPRRLRDVEELSVFGVKPADLPGERTYLEYVPRDEDGSLADALLEAIAGRRMLLVVGASAAGKSRSLARATQRALSDHRLLLPRARMLADLVELSVVRLGRAVVWLDDVELYAHAGLRDTLERLLDAGLAVVGTVRRAELERLAPPGDVRNPAGEALTDETLVSRLDWRLGWSAEERARLHEQVTHRPLLEAVETGIAPGAYLVAGPRLVQRLRDARADEERPHRYALVRTVLDWYRTGIGRRIPVSEATRLMTTSAAAEAEALGDALDWATTPVIGTAP